MTSGRWRWWIILGIEDDPPTGCDPWEARWAPDWISEAGFNDVSWVTTFVNLPSWSANRTSPRNDFLIEMNTVLDFTLVTLSRPATMTSSSERPSICSARRLTSACDASAPMSEAAVSLKVLLALGGA
jgi:hypothetical protein